MLGKPLGKQARNCKINLQRQLQTINFGTGSLSKEKKRRMEACLLTLSLLFWAIASARHFISTCDAGSAVSLFLFCFNIPDENTCKQNKQTICQKKNACCGTIECTGQCLECYAVGKVSVISKQKSKAELSQLHLFLLACARWPLNLATKSFKGQRDLLSTVSIKGPAWWRPTTVKWRQSSLSSRHSTIGTRQTEYHEALPSSANDEVRCDCTFADNGNVSWYSVYRVPMVEWRLDCENCRHLTVVGLHNTGPRFEAGTSTQSSDMGREALSYILTTSIRDCRVYSSVGERGEDCGGG